MSRSRVELADLPSMDAEIRRRSFAFNRRPGERNNRGRIQQPSGGGSVGPGGADFGALAVSNGLTVIGYYRADYGLSGSSGSGLASWANLSGAMSAITPHGGATNGIGSAGAGLNSRASLIQNGATQRGLFTAPALAASGTTNVHKYWIARQVTSTGTPRGILQDGGVSDIYLNSSATTVLVVGAGVATQTLTNNVFQRYRVSWTGAVATNEFKLGNQVAVTGTGSNITPGTTRTLGDLVNNYEWLLYIEVTGPVANFLTFATAADAATQTTWTSAVEI